MSEQRPQVLPRYGIARWGEGYFVVDAQGKVAVRPDPAVGTAIELEALAAELHAGGLDWPVLVRFVDVLRHRVRSLHEAFARAIAELEYGGGYTAIYPIKVNQQRSVVEHLVAAGADGIGLEAGSKPELMIALAQSRPGGIVVCNGYKDAGYIRLALLGQRLGHRVHLVIEKPSELAMVQAAAKALGIEPQLGVRVRLSAVAEGKWQNSGGERAKFGLSAAQLLDLVKRLQDTGCLHWLRLLHSHIGSQIPNLRDIRSGMREVAHLYAELHRLGAPIEVVDVGGGLGVDYEGTGTRDYCSMNYSLDAYAREVVHAFGQVCTRRQLPHPQLYSESGRALTAHHAVLITNLVDRDPVSGVPAAPQLDVTGHELIDWLRQELDNEAVRDPAEAIQEARHLYDECREAFEHGALTLQQRALAERLYYAIAERVRGRLRPEHRRQRELLDDLNAELAARVFVNLSLFQSLPDVWAIDQVFPVLPLAGLDRAADDHVVIHDLTCDSDGCMSRYVDQDGVTRTLPLPGTGAGEEQLLGFFLVGAYQEILGDMHNLFGDTHAVDVVLDGAGGYRVSEPEPGDSVDDLLRYLHFDPQQMLARYREKLSAQPLADADRDATLDVLAAGLRGYTYLA